MTWLFPQTPVSALFSDTLLCLRLREGGITDLEGLLEHEGAWDTVPGITKSQGNLLDAFLRQVHQSAGVLYTGDENPRPRDIWFPLAALGIDRSLVQQLGCRGIKNLRELVQAWMSGTPNLRDNPVTSNILEESLILAWNTSFPRYPVVRLEYDQLLWLAEAFREPESPMLRSAALREGPEQKDNLQQATLRAIMFPIRLALRLHILRVVGRDPLGVEREELRATLPGGFPEKILQDELERLRRQGWISLWHSRVEPNLPDVGDCLAAGRDSSRAREMEMLLPWDSCREAARGTGRSLSWCRSTCTRVAEGLPPLKEHRYRLLMNSTAITEEEFRRIFGESRRTWCFLQLFCRQEGLRQSLESAVGDRSLPEAQRECIRQDLQRRAAGSPEKASRATPKKKAASRGAKKPESPTSLGEDERNALLETLKLQEEPLGVLSCDTLFARHPQEMARWGIGDGGALYDILKGILPGRQDLRISFETRPYMTVREVPTRGQSRRGATLQRDRGLQSHADMLSQILEEAGEPLTDSQLFKRYSQQLQKVGGRGHWEEDISWTALVRHLVLTCPVVKGEEFLRSYPEQGMDFGPLLEGVNLQNRPAGRLHVRELFQSRPELMEIYDLRDASELFTLLHRLWRRNSDPNRRHVIFRRSGLIQLD